MNHPWIERRRLAGLGALTRYHVFRSPRALPRSVFDNPALVVERFLPEKRGDRYVLRQHLVFGSCAFDRICSSTDPWVKGLNSVVEPSPPAPVSILEARRAMGLDYGKMDYVICNGQAHLLDVAHTPGVGHKHDVENNRKLAQIARGITFFERTT